ncbi:MAG: type II toxin-antitoxin system HicB family antitoxin [Flavobacteriales bacterium]|nr:type II toxin-antitoxin system HicB family antitoxin [Flavobacteriales bacterium]
MSAETIHLPLIVETDEDGVFIVSCPAFKGCHSYGKTVEEAMANVREVIEMCMQEERPMHLNRFVGFREIEMPAGRLAS